MINMIVEQDRENRTSNIILYNVQEPKSANQEERWKEDREFCLELFNKVLRIGRVSKQMIIYPRSTFTHDFPYFRWKARVMTIIGHRRVPIRK